MHCGEPNVRTKKLDMQEAVIGHTVAQSRKFYFFDAGLRKDGISALDLWDLVIEALHDSAR